MKEITMTNVTRRTALKGGIAATTAAGLVAFSGRAAAALDTVPLR